MSASLASHSLQDQKGLAITLIMEHISADTSAHLSQNPFLHRLQLIDGRFSPGLSITSLHVWHIAEGMSDEFSGGIGDLRACREARIAGSGELGI